VICLLPYNLVLIIFISCKVFPCLFIRLFDTDTHNTHSYHPYRHTHAHLIHMSTSKKPARSAEISRLMKSPQTPRYVIYHSHLVFMPQPSDVYMTLANFSRFNTLNPHYQLACWQVPIQLIIHFSPYKVFSTLKFWVAYLMCAFYLFPNPLPFMNIS